MQRVLHVAKTRGANELLLHVVKIALYAWFGLLECTAFKVGALVALTAVLSSFAARHLVGCPFHPAVRSEAALRRSARSSRSAIVRYAVLNVPKQPSRCLPIGDIHCGCAQHAIDLHS